MFCFWSRKKSDFLFSEQHLNSTTPGCRTGQKSWALGNAMPSIMDCPYFFGMTKSNKWLFLLLLRKQIMRRSLKKCFTAGQPRCLSQVSLDSWSLDWNSNPSLLSGQNWWIVIRDWSWFGIWQASLTAERCRVNCGPCCVQPFGLRLALALLPCSRDMALQRGPFIYKNWDSCIPFSFIPPRFKKNQSDPSIWLTKNLKCKYLYESNLLKY